MSAVLTLTGGAADARSARRFVERVLRTASGGWDVDTAALLTSELVSNAFLHARGAVELRASVSGTRLRVQVRDREPAVPRPRTAGESEEGGRGLLIVDRLAADWGAYTLHTAAGEEKVVWFELQQQPARRLDLTLHDRPVHLSD